MNILVSLWIGLMLVMFISVCVDGRIGVLLWLRLLGLFMRMVF